VHKNKTFLAIIPARGGSKRLSGKNILNMHGKPLIAWSIEAGLNSKYIDKVVVSSDDAEILSISKRFGAETIIRPREIADDTSTTFDAIKHTIDNFEKYDNIVLLQPTSPLRNVAHIDEAIELMDLKGSDAIVSVCLSEHNPLWSGILPDNEDMSYFLSKDIRNKRSQELDAYYRLNGAIYICKTARLAEEETFLIKSDIFAYKMGREYSVDIDEQIDFEFAEFLMERYFGKV